MTEFIKICAIVGLFTVYLAITGGPALMVYHWLTEVAADNKDMKLWKSLLIAYGIGVIIAVTMGTYFMIY